MHEWSTLDLWASRGSLGNHIATALGCSLDPQVVSSVSIRDMSCTELGERQLMVDGIFIVHQNL